ncbi:COP9 signalosome complex subunit 8 [Strongylocentrotus purpuratus]|uniref:COP9 signalosome complex subunit 8 n=1 Tax=Strongylocentrotus purpuratus TaxID=7668 RepID=A0A7M7G0P7_STRPU|nr:COP9 signalosome complex subunit 8 [Strongylocentrotus purpuratus]|eukprot:XP_001185403.2 PREDICTED: COP9 signalosome complex subunit 8 [Strongylocentrotus purpuratus]
MAAFDAISLVEQCEQQELEAPGGVASPELYKKLLALYLLQNDLNNAKFLWKRIPAAVKTADPELGYIWEIGQNMWQRDFSSSKLYSALNREWSDVIKEIISALSDSIKQRLFQLVGNTYTSIEDDQFASYLGMSKEQAINAVQEEGWSYNSTTQMILPKKPVPSREAPAPSEQQIAQLTEFVAFLEN